MEIVSVKQLDLLVNIIGRQNVKLFKKIQGGIPPFQPSFYRLWIFRSPLEVELDKLSGFDKFRTESMMEAFSLCTEAFDSGESWTAIFYSGGQYIKPTVEISRYYRKLPSLKNIFYCGNHEIGPCGRH